MKTLLPVAVALTAFAGLARAEPLVVIESTLPSLAPGATVDGAAALNLPERSRVVLVSETGKTVALNGPWQGKPGAGGTGGGDPRLVTALASLVRTAQEDSHSVGAIRAAGIKTRADALMINLSESGDYCIADPKAVDVTRYGSETGASVTLNAVKGDHRASLSWPAGRDRTAWPADLPLEDGATYLVEQDGKDSRTMLVVHTIVDDMPTDAHRAVFMMEKDCLEQAKMLLALLRKAG